MNLHRRGLLGGGLFAGLATIFFGNKHVESSTPIVGQTTKPEIEKNTSPIAAPWSDAEEMECTAQISYEWKFVHDTPDRIWNYHSYGIKIRWRPGQTQTELINEARRAFREAHAHQTSIVYREITVTGFLFPV